MPTRFEYPPLGPGQSFTPGPQRAGNVQAGGEALARIIAAIKQRRQTGAQDQAVTDLFQELMGPDQAGPSVIPRTSPVTGLSVSPRTELEQFDVAGAQPPSALQREFGVDTSFAAKFKNLSPEMQKQFTTFAMQRKLAQDKAKLALPAQTLKFKKEAEATRLKTETAKTKAREDAINQIQKLNASLYDRDGRTKRLPQAVIDKTQESIDYYQKKLDALEGINGAGVTAPGAGAVPTYEELIQQGFTPEQARAYLAGEPPPK